MVDPRKRKKQQLLEHATSVLKGHIHLVSSPDIEVIVAQYHRESVDDDLVRILLASVALPSPAAGAQGGRPTRGQRRGAARGGERAEGEEAGSDAQSDLETGHEAEEDGVAAGKWLDGGQMEEVEEKGEGEGEVGAKDAGDDEVLDVNPQPAPAGGARARQEAEAKQAATASTTGAKRTRTASSAGRPAPSPTTQVRYIRRETRLAHCIACTYLCDNTDRTPKQCIECGNPWGGPVPLGATTASTSGPTATAPTPAAPTITNPTTWEGAAFLKPKALDTLVHGHSKSRASGLAALDERIVRHAQEGKQHHTIAGLLPLLAEDGDSMTAGVSNSAILIDADDGTLTPAVGAAATSARTAASCRRTVDSFTDIAEVLLFSLIGRIYFDRPDIGQHFPGLLILAQDLTRAYG